MFTILNLLCFRALVAEGIDVKKNVFFTFLTLFLFSVRFFKNKNVENLLSMQANSEIQFFVRNVS